MFSDEQCFLDFSWPVSLFISQHNAFVKLCYDLQQLHVLQLPVWMAAGVYNVACVLSHKYPISLSPLCLTTHFMCVQSFHMVNIDVLAGIGAPSLDTQSPTSDQRTG